MGLAYARNLTDRFSVGVKGKLVSETIGFSNAQTFAVDIGTLFITGFHGMRLGMSISNFGGKMLMMGTEQMVKADADELIGGSPEEDARLETENWALPMIFRFGLAMDILDSEYSRFTVNVGMDDPRDMNPYGNCGVEYAFKNMAFVRGGLLYRPKDFNAAKLAEEEELVLNYEIRYSFGGGLILPVPGISSKMRIDYSYSENGLFTTTQRITVALLF